MHLIIPYMFNTVAVEVMKALRGFVSLSVFQLNYRERSLF